MPKNKEKRGGPWIGLWLFGFILFLVGSAAMCVSGEALKVTIIGATLSIVGCLWIVIAELMQTREERPSRGSE